MSDPGGGHNPGILQMRKYAVEIPNKISSINAHFSGLLSMVNDRLDFSSSGLRFNIIQHDSVVKSQGVRIGFDACEHGIGGCS